MTLAEYMRMFGKTVLNVVEIEAFGVEYKKGWARRYANVLISEEDAIKLKAAAWTYEREKQKSAIPNPRPPRPPLPPVKRSVRKKFGVSYKSSMNIVASKDFYKTAKWRELRYQALVTYGAICACCGATAKDGVRLHVDHIKPRSLYPILELTLSNLQVLCEECNLGKSNIDETDWR